ncbi:MAG: DASS family sodium-coupled anion symporter [Bacteroidia bacterium]|nr:DASS family sodium-coupled anion symporter [Bacteroidia bacterium]
MSLKRLGFILAPLIFLMFVIFQPLQTNIESNRMAGIVIWMAIWWMSECVHLAVTSLLPVVLLPLCQIADIKQVAYQYGHPIIFLFLGGFLISIAIEKWDLHKRIARNILRMTGHSVNGILAGVMVSTFLLSNWISNTATALMLLSAVMALLFELEDVLNHQDKLYFSAALMLGMAYAASIGGMATPVGTPPNMYFFKAYPQMFSHQVHLSFIQWIILFLPLSLIILTGCFFILKLLFLNKISVRKIDIQKLNIHRKYKITYEEKVVFVVFILTVLLWLTRDVYIEFLHFRGWKYFFEHSEYMDDSLVAIAASIILFIIPAKKDTHKTILTWEDAKQLKYDILLLFGGGFALSYGFEKSGLINYAVEQLVFVKNIHPLALIFIICLVVCIISEFASNIASVQLALPVIAAITSHFSSEMTIRLVLPCVLSASVGFMLPVATAPNTIAFGSGKIPLQFMLKAGFWLDIFSIFAITIYCYWVL